MKATDEFWKNADLFATTIGLKKDIINDLLNASDDWTFIAKVHFIIESSLKKMLTDHLDNKSLEEEIYSMPFKSIIKWCLKLKIIEFDLVTVIDFIQKLRNNLVHNPNNLYFSLEKYLSDKNEQKYYSIFHPYLPKEIKIKQHLIKRKQFMLENPRIAIYFALMNLLGVGHLNNEIIEMKKKTKIIKDLRVELPKILNEAFKK